jgi:hypothetical protein
MLWEKGISALRQRVIKARNEGKKPGIINASHIKVRVNLPPYVPFQFVGSKDST